VLRILDTWDIVNATGDFVENAEDMVNNSCCGHVLFNVIVVMYKKWSRYWKAANPEPSPDSSYASVSSSRASSRTPQPHPVGNQGHSSTPSPRARPRPTGAYRPSAHSASVASVTPSPHHSPSSVSDPSGLTHATWCC
jgi:hypothetical protein